MKPLASLIAIALLTCNQGFAADNTSGSETGQNIMQISISPRSADLTQRIDSALKAKGANYEPRTEHLLANGQPRFTNRLIQEDSPYLIQHAHNPMDWYAWGPEAFEAAKKQNKPIFLSIGYSTCHWCHVMERESFENIEIANAINKNFIAIKVDREQRPDIDETYMTAVQLMTRGGGWPMSSFLTPDGKPFHGGTYFPPNIFLDLSQRVATLWKERQSDLIDRANMIAEEVEKLSNSRTKAGKVSAEAVQKALGEIVGSLDEFLGGFGDAPKFPNEPMLFLLLQAAERYSNTDAVDATTLTLGAMARGGIFDQVGGGFHRYSTDNEWLVPHFEKMLYNQAHLSRVYLLAWRLTGDPFFKRVAVQTLDYVLRDMTSPDGAFYSATDADSEGEEGTFFLWTKEQIISALSEDDASLAIKVFDVDENGNFEGSNILSLPEPLPAFAEDNNLNLTELLTQIDRIREQLYNVREQREHPLRDEKILTGWNGMMISTLSQAGVLLNEEKYAIAAQTAAEFIWQHNHISSGGLWRVYLNGNASITANQEDYAYYAESLLHLYDATADKKWLQRASELAETMLTYFWDDQSGGFYMSRSEEQLTAMGRPRDGGSDNAIPSGNSVALRVLQMLSVRSANLDYADRANATLAAFAESINRFPSGFGYMLTAADDLSHGELNAKRYAALGGIQVHIMQAGANRVTVALDIPKGWHINSNQPLQDNLIPTAISIKKGNDNWQLKSINYPTPKTQHLGFQKALLSLYDGRIEFDVELEAGLKFSRMLPLQLNLQACNDRVCLPPEAVVLRTPMEENN